MAAFLTRITDHLVPMAFYSMLTGGFLLLCTFQKLAGDFSAGKTESILVRLLFIILISVVIGYRLRQSMVPLTTRSLCSFFLVLLFFGVLYYPIFSQVSYLGKSVNWTKHEITKNHESKPDKLVALVRHFPTLYEKYMEKNLHFSKLFVNLDALVKIYGLNVSPNNNVAVGQDGFYFEGWGARRVEKGIIEKFDNIADYMGQIPFTEDELKQWKKTLEERKYWLKEQGIDYVFILAPTKALVYQEFLPSALQRAVAEKEGITRYEQLTDYLSKNADINFIDLLPPLLEAKKKRDYPLLFYKTDFHWNFYGAFIAYQAIIEELKEFYPHYNLELPSFSEFDLSIDEHWAHHRFMDMVGLPTSMHKNEHYITMVPKPGGPYDSAQDLPAEGIYDVYPPKRKITADSGETMEIRLLRNPDAPIPSILLLGDSFFEKLVYFFSRDGQRVMNFRTIVNFPDAIFKFEKPNLVIQEILNMFILREPPKNPPGFRPSYLRGKFSDGRDRVLLITNPDVFLRTDKGVEIDTKDSLKYAHDVVRIAKLSIESPQDGTVKFTYADDQGTTPVSEKIKVEKGVNVVYLELPNFSVSKIIVSADTGPSEELEINELEIRSEGGVDDKIAAN